MDDQTESSVRQPALPTGWPGWVLNGLAVASAGGAYVLAAVAAGTTGTARAVLLVGGGLLAAGVVATQLVKQRRDAQQIKRAREVAQEAEAAYGGALSGALAPITEYLGELSELPRSTDRGPVVGKLTQAIVNAAVLLTVVEARSAFYRYDAAERRLVREAYAGRTGVPRPEFVSGTEDGDVVLDLVDRGDLIRIDDVVQDPLVRPSPMSGYTCVIAAAVSASDLRLGMLTVDAPGAGDLRERHAQIVHVLANLLGAGRAGGASDARGATRMSG